MNRRTVAAAALVTLAVAGAAVAQSPIIAGPVPALGFTEKVACRSDPTQTYTLFLPPGYAPDQRRPVLFVFDPRGRGTLAARIFADAAGRYGWILASSDNTRSDGPWEPNGRALQAMWPDVMQRYGVDPRRVYAAGFSGGGMVAWTLGRESGHLAGVIGSGMRLPDEPAGRTGTFAFFGAAGADDANRLELKRIDEVVGRWQRPRRLEIFDGAHVWLPPDLVMRAVAWFEVLAIRDQQRPRDQALVDDVFGREMAQARAFEQAGAPLDAVRLYRVIADAFAGLVDLTAVRQRIAALEQGRALADAVKAERKWDDFLLRRLGDVSAILRRVHAAGELPPPGAALADLGVPGLQKQAQKPGAEGHAAQAVLEFVFTQTSYYLPQLLIGRGDLTRAALFLTIAESLKPRDIVAYNLASVYARLGQKRQAIDALRRAIDRGFDDRATLETDHDLDSLRAEPAFRELLGRLGGRTVACLQLSVFSSQS